MDKLSNEVLSLIVSHLYAKAPPPLNINELTPKPPPTPYAIVSQRWQPVVEARTFADIKLRSTELSTFSAMFAAPRRRAILHRLDYSVSLPRYGDSRDEHATNVAAFLTAVKELFSLLKDWESNELEEGNHAGRLQLRISVDFDVDTSEGPAEFRFDALKSAANRRYLTLGEDVDLPKVQRITSLAVSASPGRAPHPTAMCRLAAAAPNLEKLELEYLDPVNKRREMRKEHRLALAAGLGALRLPKLAHLCIQRQSVTQAYNHSFDHGDLGDDGVDVLNDALRKMSQTAPLAELHLSDALISSDLFRDCGNIAESGSSSTWPSLKRISVKAGIVAPSGKWYYTGDPNAVEPGDDIPITDFSDEDEDDDSDAGSDDSDDDPDRDAVANGTRPTHSWRTRPDPEIFDPLIKDIADAVLQMPQLQSGHFEIGCDYGDFITVFFNCAEAGQEFANRPDCKRDTEEEKKTRRWHVWVGTDTQWDVPGEVEESWRTWLGENGKILRSRWPMAF